MRKAALDGLFGLSKTGVIEDGDMIRGCYFRAVELLNDMEDCVRSSAIQAVSFVKLLIRYLYAYFYVLTSFIHFTDE